MTIFNSIQICGPDSKITVKSHSGAVWVTIRDGDVNITMNPCHVRALAAALDDYEAAQAKGAA